MNDKRTAATQTAKEQRELQSMLAELKKMQLASLMGSQGKSTVILTDQTDLGDKIDQLTTKLVAAVKSTDVTGMSKEQTDLLQRIVDAHANLRAEYTKQALDTSRDSKALLEAIKSLKLSTVVNVPDQPAPSVTLRERAIDFTPLQNTMRELWERPDYQLTSDAPKIDLDCYRAQDINDYDDDTQYVGFVNPDGDWYIIENKIKANKMRYVFGTGSYSRAFKEAPTYKYQLLDKAIKRATA